MSMTQTSLPFGRGQQHNRRSTRRSRTTVSNPRLPSIRNLQEALKHYAVETFVSGRGYIDRVSAKWWVRCQDFGKRVDGSISGSLTILCQRGELGKLYRRRVNPLTGRMLHLYATPDGADMMNQRDAILAHLMGKSGLDTEEIRQILDTVDRKGWGHFPPPDAWVTEANEVYDWDELLDFLNEDDDDDVEPATPPF